MLDREWVRRAIGKVVRWAVTDGTVNEKGDYPVAQVSFKRRPGDSTQISPWGFHSSPPADQLAALMTIDGAADLRAHIVATGKQRPRIASGEVVVFHPSTGAKIHFKKDGDIEITAVDQARIVAPNGLTIDADTHINGAVQISSDLTVGGDTDLGNGAARTTTIGGATAGTAGILNIFGTWGATANQGGSASGGVLNLGEHGHHHHEDGSDQTTSPPQAIAGSG